MNSWETVNALKADILKPRRQRVRRSTYNYLAGLMIEDTAPENPFRNRMVIDWWSRVVDPLEAEKFNEERLRYFRVRLDEHRRAAAVNAAIRQGVATGKPLRRLSPSRLAYVRHQVKRLADRKLNSAAADRAVQENDQAYENLFLGLLALPELTPGRNSFVYKAVSYISRDERSEGLFQKAVADAETLFPGVSARALATRIGQVRNPFDQVWLTDPDDYVENMKEAALIRKLEDEYMNGIR